MRGRVFKRCRCPASRDSRGRLLACKKAHGSWAYIVDIGKDLDTGKRRQELKSGFATKEIALDALNEALDALREGSGVSGRKTTVKAWLTEWLAIKADTRAPKTVQGYRHHVEDILIPAVGHKLLHELEAGDVERVCRTYAATPTRLGRARTDRDVELLRDTLRSALTTARKRKLVKYNAAADALIRTAARSKVSPWSPGDLGAFLDHASADPLYGAMFELMAATGLRRGEACGLHWEHVDLQRGVIWVGWQLVQVGKQEADRIRPCPHCGGGTIHKGRILTPPKTPESMAPVDLDGHTVGVLLAHQLAQQAHREDLGEVFVDHGLVFPQDNGIPLRPEEATRRFNELAAEVRVPDPGKKGGPLVPLRKVTLHTAFRHGHASLGLAAGLDMVVVSKRMRHSKLGITSDTYTHMLEGVGKAAAEAANALVPRSGRDLRDQSVINPSAGDPAE